MNSLLPAMPWSPGKSFPGASYLIGYAQAEGIPHRLTVIDEIDGVRVPPGTFEAFVNGMTTQQVLALLFSEMELTALCGEAVVIDDCDEPHITGAGELSAFLDWHEENLGFPFRHDLVLLFPESGRVSALHHGGAVLHIFPDESVCPVAPTGQIGVS